MDNAITSFRGQYAFLSNYYECPIIYKGKAYRNAEAAFQAQKEPQRAWDFTCLSASGAKKLGRSVQLRQDWEQVKDKIMYQVVFSKFSQNENLLRKLLATNNTPLIEGNDWGDTYWGVCNAIGKNKLGKILERVRSDLM